METASRIVVATDDERIYSSVKKFGGEAVMTSPDHVSGTDRIAEVANSAAESIIVNIQGDEPFIDAAAVDRAVEALAIDPSLSVATLCTPTDAASAADPNVTCVVTDLNGYALYFSKLPIPNDRDGDAISRPLLKHLGVYIFRRQYLAEFTSLDSTPLEKCEKLEQLRILEHGHRILCIKTDHDSLGIDSEDDLEHARELIKSGVV